MTPRILLRGDSRDLQPTPQEAQCRLDAADVAAVQRIAQPAP